jgi:hypothetical protein
MTQQKLSDYLAKPIVLGGCLALVWLISLAFAVALQPATDIAWRYFIAGGILEGKTLYRDLVDLNPPLWFWAAVPSVWIGNVLGVGGHVAAMTLAHLSSLLALALFAKGIEGILSKSERGVALVGFLIAILWVAVADVGQREQSALIASVLWLILALRRDAQLPVSLGLSVSIACYCAYGFALKHYFVLIPLAIEVTLAVRLGRKWKPIRPETLVLGALAIGYALLVFFFAHDFLAEIVPVAAMSYDSFNAWTGESTWFALLMIIGPAQFLFAPLVIAIRLKEKRPIILGLLGLSLLFLLIIIGQMKGFFYHYIALKGVSFLVLVLWLGRDEPMGALDTWLVRLGLVGFFLSMIVSPVKDVISSGVTPVSGTLQTVIKAEPPANDIMILSTVPQHSFYVLVTQGRTFGSRHYSMWMIPGLMVQAQDKKNATAAKTRLARVRQEYFEDIKCFAPAVLISHRENFGGRHPIQTDSMAFLRGDPAVDSWLAGHYRFESAVEDFQVWRQMRPLNVDEANCPSKSR